MNSSNKGLTDNKAAMLGALNKVTTLNPNAAEFVPTSLKYTYGITKSYDATERDLSGSSKSAVLDQSVSNTSNNSDDELHQYWHHRLPDDITPEFKAIQEDLHEPGHLTLSGLSIHDTLEQSKFSTSMTNQLFNTRQDLSSLASDNANLHGKMGYPGSIYANEQSSVVSLASASNIWGKQHINGERQWKGHHYDLDYNTGLVDDLIGKNLSPENVTDPIEFLSSQFPGFAAQSLASIYYGNGCDLNLTIEILTQLEVDVDFDQNVDLNSLDAPKLSTLDISAVPAPDSRNGLPKYTGDDVQHGSSIYRTPGISRGGIDFSSTVRKLSSQDSGHWRNERNSFGNAAAGSSRSSQLLFRSYDGSNKMVHGDKWHTTGAARSRVSVGTEEPVANIYSESREEAHDFARLQNTCFEQARFDYLIGNKTFVKELSSKGQLYNLQMRAAHEKAKETIYRERNPLSPEIQGYSQGQNRLIDLHGLHVTEAVHVLNHELRILRNTARATGQRLHVMICVGTGHHTKGSRTPVRLPVAVEQYLLDEGLHYTQPQPGLLRVVIY